MKKIIVAESSPTIKSVADSLLRQSGYDVVCTSDGMQAWNIISSERPDLVFTGLNLSLQSGLELCRKITKDPLTGGIPVVLLIGASDSIRDEEIAASGARGTLKKPFSPRDLLEITSKLAGTQQSPVVVSGNIDSVFSTQETTRNIKTTKDSYNLEWLDLNDVSSPGSGTKKITLDFTHDDHTVLVDEDQYGLSNPIFEEPEEVPSPIVSANDSDYDWFIGEIKREMEGKKPDNKKIENEKTIVNDPPKPAVDDELGFGDISSTEKFGIVDNSKDKLSIASGFDDGLAIPSKKQPGIPPIKLSDEQIAKIADQIASRIASMIISKLDRNMIIEMIRAALKP